MNIVYIFMLLWLLVASFTSTVSWLSLLSSARQTPQIYLTPNLSDTHGRLRLAPEALEQQATQADRFLSSQPTLYKKDDPTF